MINSFSWKHYGGKIFPLTINYLNRKNNNAFRQFTSSPVLEKAEEMFPQRLVLPENRGFVPILSPAQVTASLSLNEAIGRGIEGGVVSYFESSQLAANSPIEDRRALGNLLRTSGQLFSVIDGHGGAACGQAISERIFDYIALTLLSPQQLEEFNRALRVDTAYPLVEKYQFKNDYFSEDLSLLYRQSLMRFVTETLSTFDEDTDDPISKTIVGRLKSAYIRLDDDISQEAMPSSVTFDEDLLSIALSGACCCTVHINGLELTTANVGDCRAVVGSVREGGRWEFTVLSTDHNVENTKELRRLHRSHPKAESGTLVKSGRLLSHLIPVRAFGDVRFKWKVSELKNLVNLLGNTSYAQSIIPSHYYTPPYLIARPEVTNYVLRPSDRFLVLASDGLWEMLTNEKVVDIVGSHLQGQMARDKTINIRTQTLDDISAILEERQRGLHHQSTDTNGATHLLRHALGFQHKKVSEMLTFPPRIARSYRDDITIIIVYFDQQYIQQHSTTTDSQKLNSSTITTINA